MLLSSPGVGCRLREQEEGRNCAMRQPTRRQRIMEAVLPESHELRRKSLLVQAVFGERLMQCNKCAQFDRLLVHSLRSRADPRTVCVSCSSFRD